jgi:hypothetical protein
VPNNAPQLPVSPESLARKHEVSEKRVCNPLVVVGASAFLVVFSLLASGAILYGFAQGRRMQNMQPLGLIIAPNMKPLERFPKPNLDTDDDHGERKKLYEAQSAELNSYGWINRSNGVLHIPIERAMDLILARGLPTDTNSQTTETPLQLIQKIPEQP